MKVIFFDGSLEQGKRLLIAQGVSASNIRVIDHSFGFMAMRHVVENSNFSPNTNLVYLANSFEVIEEINSTISANFGAEAKDILLNSSVYLKQDGSYVQLQDMRDPASVKNLFDTIFGGLKHTDEGD